MAWTGSSATGALAPARALPRLSSGALTAQTAMLIGLGIAGALLHSVLKLRLGIPGHAALLWLVPILLGRGLAPMAAAGTLATTSLASGLLAFGGLGRHWPLAASFGTFWLVGPVLDLCVFSFERGATHPRLTGRWAWLLLPMAGVVGNLAHLALKVAFGAMWAHPGALGLPGWLFESASHAVFGLAAGIVAYAILVPFGRRRAAQ